MCKILFSFSWDEACCKRLKPNTWKKKKNPQQFRILSTLRLQSMDYGSQQWDPFKHYIKYRQDGNKHNLIVNLYLPLIMCVRHQNASAPMHPVADYGYLLLDTTGRMKRPLAADPDPPLSPPCATETGINSERRWRHGLLTLYMHMCSHAHIYTYVHYFHFFLPITRAIHN